MTEPTTESRRDRRAILLLICAGAGVWLFFAGTTFSGLTVNDGYNYAACARNFLEGEGFLWESRNVQEFASVPEDAALSRDAFNHAAFFQLLYPLILAGAFLVGGANELTVIAVNGLFFLATIPFVYLLARRIFGFHAAVLAGGLFVGSAKMLYYSASGGPFTLYAFLLTGAALLLLTGVRWRSVLGGGVLAGLIWWTKSSGGVIAATLVAFTAVARWSDLRWRAGLAVVAGVAVVVLCVRAVEPAMRPESLSLPSVPSSVESDGRLPGGIGRLADVWLTRALIFSDERPGHALERSLEPFEGRSVWEGRTDALVGKMRRNAAEVAAILFRHATQPVVVWLFWIGGVLSIRDPASRRLFLLTVALLAVQGVICTALFVMHRYFHVFIPLLIVGAAGMLVRIGRWIAARRKPVSARLRAAAIAATIVALSYPWCFIAGLLTVPVRANVAVCDVQCWYAGKESGARREQVGAFLRARTRRDEVVVTDAPWVTWWYGDRTSIWLPVDMETMNGLRSRVQVDWLLISFEYWRGLEFWKDWLRRAGDSGGTLDGFRFEGAYVDGDYAAYLFRAVDSNAERAVDPESAQ